MRRQMGFRQIKYEQMIIIMTDTQFMFISKAEYSLFVIYFRHTCICINSAYHMCISKR